MGVAGAAACWAEGWDGAAGTAGVLATGWAGVAGGAEDSAAGAAGAAGFDLGCRARQRKCPQDGPRENYLVHHADDEALLLNVVGADRVIIFQDLA